MDKLSEHAIRMLEIADANDIPVIGNKQFQDMAQAIYDLILQVQMLKMAKRKTVPHIVGKHADVIIIDEPQTDCAWGKGE